MMKIMATMIFIGCLVLSALGSSIYAQELGVVVQGGIYDNSNLFDNLRPNQAVILYTLKPRSVSDINVITYQDLAVRGIDLSDYTQVAPFGRYYMDPYNDTRYVAGIINAESYFLSGSSNAFLNNINPKLYDELVSNNLGTVTQRTNYISFARNTFKVVPTDFRSYLRDWIIVGIVFFLALPMWYLVKRFLR